jgi:hypothetical protein
MTIEAIVANMDAVWTESDASAQHVAKHALKRFLQSVHDDGYPLLLVSDLNAASLNDAIVDKLGDEGITYFSSILSSSAHASRYAVALHTLETPADRVAAVSAEEHGFDEARNSGITQCVALSDALRHGRAPFSLASSSDQSDR